MEELSYGVPSWLEYSCLLSLLKNYVGFIPPGQGSDVHLSHVNTPSALDHVTPELSLRESQPLVCLLLSSQKSSSPLLCQKRKKIVSLNFLFSGFGSLRIIRNLMT